MAFFKVFSLLLIQTTALIHALPTIRLSREVAPPPVTVVQSSLTGSGQSIHTGDTNYCLSVRDTNVPTSIHLTQQDPGSYNLVSYYSTDCSTIEYRDVTPQSLRNARIINGRKPICSFQLTDAVEKTVTVTFSGSTSRAFEVADTSCVNICSGSQPEFPSLAYALSANIQVDGRETNNGIHLFTETGCETKLRDEPIRDGDNLVELTRENARIVKSFLIKEKS